MTAMPLIVLAAAHLEDANLVVLAMREHGGHRQTYTELHIASLSVGESA